MIYKIIGLSLMSIGLLIVILKKSKSVLPMGVVMAMFSIM